MTPAWMASTRSLRQSLGPRHAPLLGMGAAFSFTVMMLNFPLAGGTTAHPLGAVLLSVMLGPHAAVVGMTVALAIQALFFGDGGILALPANCFAMALAMPVTGYWAFRLLRGRSENPSRIAWASGAAAYAGVAVASLLVAVLLGVQPTLFREGERALYFPFGLDVTIPAIVLPHLLVVGFVEAAVTAAATGFLLKAGFRPFGETQEEARSARWSLAWSGLGLLLALTPLGLLATGDAWGEWSAEDLAGRAGYLPSGLARIEEQGWKGFLLLPDYLGDRGWPFYVFSGLAGAAACAGASWLFARALRRESPPGDAPPGTPPPNEGDLPDWLQVGSDGKSSETGRVSSRRGSFAARSATAYLEKSLLGLSERSRDALCQDRWAQMDGLLQRVPAVWKTAGAFLTILLAALTGLPAVLGALFLAAAIAAILSKLSFRSFLARGFAPTLFFGACFALPGALNLAHPGMEVFVLSRSPRLSVTVPGLEFAGLALLRLLAIASIAALLSMTTRWTDLVAALRTMRVPEAFLSTTALTYRYLAVFSRAAADVLTARKSRQVGQARTAGARRFVGDLAGSLLANALRLAGEVEEAMLARGGLAASHPRAY